MDNPGTSINFDAQAFYTAEENERDFEDEQQENELKNLLCNEFDDDLLDMDDDDDDDDDDDEDTSSSDMSLYGNTNNPHHHHHHHHHKKMTNNNNNVLTTVTNTAPTAVLANGKNIINYSQKQIIYNQMYSTPAINQQPPTPSLKLNMNEQTINYENHLYLKENDDDDDDENDDDAEPPQPRELIHPTPQKDINENEQPKLNENHHLHLGNDHHLNNGDEDNGEQASKFHFGNGLQLELNQHQMQTPKNPNYNVNSNGIQMNHEYDAENFDELNIDQFEFMNLDKINHAFGKLKVLYNARGKKLDEVTNRFEAYKEDVTRELRAMMHRVNLAEDEKQKAQVSLEQSKQLCQQYQTDVQIMNKQNQEVKMEVEKLKGMNGELLAKLQEANEDIEALNYQLEQQQNLDSIERLKTQNEQIVTQMREKYEHEMFLMKESLNKNELELNEKHHLCDLLRSQLDQSLKQSDQALIERGETINRLNKRLLELQKQYDDLLVLRNINSSEVSQTNMKLYEKITYLENVNQDREKYFQQLQERNKDLEEQVKLFEAMQLCNQQQQHLLSDSNITEHGSLLSSTAATTPTTNDTLKKELERSLNLLKAKRNDITKYQNEIQKLKDQLSKSQPLSSQQQQANSLNASQKNVIDELTKEKTYLQNDIDELKLKLEDSYRQTDTVSQEKQELENELYLRSEQIEILNNELAKQKEETSGEFIEERLKIEFKNERVQLISKYELNIQSLKHDLDNSNAEVIKLKQLYVDICNEKNDIEDRMRESCEKDVKKIISDYEMRIKNFSLDFESKARGDHEKNVEQLVNEHERRVKIIEEKYVSLEKTYENDKVVFKNEIERNYQTSKLAEKSLQNEINELKVERKRIETNYKVEIDGLMKEKSSLIEKCANLEKESRRLNVNEIDSLNFKLKAYENQIENFKNEKFNLIERISILEKEADKAKKMSHFENEIEALNKQVKIFEVDVARLEKEKVTLNEKLVWSEREIENFRRLNNKQNEVDALQQRIADYEKSIEELNRKYLDEKMGLIKQEGERYQSLESELKMSKIENVKVSQKYDSLKAEYDSLNARYKNEYNQLKSQNDEVNKKFSKELEGRLNEELNKLSKIKQNLENAFKVKETELNEHLEKSKHKVDETQQQYNELSEKYESSRQQFEKEKTMTLARKEEEFQKVIGELEKRFEDDYSKFIQSYKENLARTLQEKSDEFVREKDSLNGMYEKKISELEDREQNLLKQVKELKKNMSTSSNYSTQEVQTTPRTAHESELAAHNNYESTNTTSTCERLHLTNLQQSNSKLVTNAIANKEMEFNNEINRLKEENESLNKQIKTLEELINSTDHHFETEIDKLKDEFEADYRQRLEHELDQKEIEHQHLLNQLNIQNEQNLQNELETLRKKLLSNNEADDKLSIYKQQQQEKFFKLKQELNLREKQVEQLEIQSKNKVEKLKFDYEKAIGVEKESFEKLRKDLDDQFKSQTQRIKQENENLQLFIQKLKKTNADSDKLIQNLKDELNNTQSTNMDEIKSLKLNMEREKDILQQKIDQLTSKLQKTEKLITENDDKTRNDMETMKAKLKEQYGQELSKMNAKMKDMMKSHGNAIELLKKQHTAEKAKHGIDDRFKPMTFSTTCQTDVTYNDIKLLETFREKYLETINKMKTDMIRQFDEQTARLSDKLRREIDEERNKLGEKIRIIFFRKLNELLRDYRLTESIIRSIIHELEQELNQILTEKPSSSLSATTANPRELEHNDSTDKLNNLRHVSPRSTATSSGSGAVENKRYQNLTLQKHMEHDNISVHSADMPITKNRQFSANLRKVNEIERVTGKPQSKGNEKIQQNHNELKDMQPFYSASLSSFQNQDAKSDSGNGSSCHDTSKHRATPTFKGNEAHMTTSTTSTTSSSHSKQLSYEDQSGIGSSPKSATRNYKYTPLRQSWSNLNQLSQLSPFNFDRTNDHDDSDITSEPIVKAHNTANVRKERPTSASNILLRTNMMLASLNENKSQSSRRPENDIYSVLSNNSNNNSDTTNNTIRSFSVNNGFDKELPIETTTNRYGSLPRSTASTNQQTNAKLLTIPAKARPYSAGHISDSGLSIYKDSSPNPTTTVQTIEAKSTKTGATITTNNNNYNYAIESDYYDQFVDDNLPVKELDVSTSTVASSVSAALLSNNKNKPTSSTTVTNNSNMLSTYQKLRTSIQSGSYRPAAATTPAPNTSATTAATSNMNAKKSAVTMTTVNNNKINGELIAAPTSSSYRVQANSNNNTSSSSNSSRNQIVMQPRKKQNLT